MADLCGRMDTMGTGNTHSFSFSLGMLHESVL